MTQVIKQPGRIVDIRLPKTAIRAPQMTMLVKTSDLEVFQLVIPAGEEVPTHALVGQVVVHCLHGRVLLLTRQETLEIGAGHLLYYSANEPFSIQGLENAVLLVTVVLPKTGATVELIG